MHIAAKYDRHRSIVAYPQRGNGGGVLGNLKNDIIWNYGSHSGTAQTPCDAQGSHEKKAKRRHTQTVRRSQDGKMDRVGRRRKKTTLGGNKKL